MTPTTPTKAQGPLLAAALTYATRGWHVFPLHPDSKRPACPDHRAADCDHTDPRCREQHTGWEGRATTEPQRITKAWSSRSYGIGIACGPSGLVVLDLDTATDDETPPAERAAYSLRDGAGMLAMLAVEANATVPATHTVTTISGGTHRYYRAPDDARLGNSAGLLGWLIDTRGHGGYVVAPPTTIAGHAYAISDDREPVPLPGWLTEQLTCHHTPPHMMARQPVVPADRVGAYVAAAIAGESTKVRAALPGTRNHALFCAAVALGQLVAGGSLADADAQAALIEASTKHIAAGAFTTTEAEATIRSGLTTGARNPRTAA
ncbi:MAG: bifunctional DNA primase/polymerase [Pseudonocardiaceae bacterium]